jgi:hypothetical protein
VNFCALGTSVGHDGSGYLYEGRVEPDAVGALSLSGLSNCLSISCDPISDRNEKSRSIASVELASLSVACANGDLARSDDDRTVSLRTRGGGVCGGGGRYRVIALGEIANCGPTDCMPTFCQEPYRKSMKHSQG